MFQKQNRLASTLRIVGILYRVANSTIKCARAVKGVRASERFMDYDTFLTVKSGILQDLRLTQSWFNYAVESLAYHVVDDHAAPIPVEPKGYLY
jgi:hypothetical protein